MIGIIQERLVFEFRDINDLSISLNKYIESKSCDMLFIVDKHNSIKGILFDNTWKQLPNLIENETYYLYGTIYNNKYLKLDTDDILPSIDWQLGPELYKQKSQRYPAEL